MSAARLHDEVDQIRHIARSFHFDAIEELAGTLQSALSLHGLGSVLLSYLDRMRDAIGAEMPTAVILPMPMPVPLSTARAVGIALHA